MTRPTILIEILLGAVWTDITDKVRLAAGITVTRGRDNEQTSPNPGTLVFTVDNSDGRFTFGKTDGPYGANFKRWIQVRYTAGGSRRFTGWVAKAPAAWNRKSRAMSDVTITCIDLMGTMAMSPVATSWASSLIGDLAPLAWWRLDEPEGATVAADSAGSANLTCTAAGAAGHQLADLMSFGAEGPASLEADSMLTLTPQWDAEAEPESAYFAYADIQGTLSTIPLPCTIFAIHTRPPNPDPLLDGDMTGIPWVTIWQTFKTGPVRITLSRRLGGADLQIEVRTSSAWTATIPNFFQPGVPTLTAVVITAATVTALGGSAVASGFPTNSDPLSGGTFYLGRNSSLGAMGPGSGSTGQVAILPGAMSEATFAGLKARLLGDGLAPVAEWLNRAASEAGVSTAVTATTNRDMQRPQIKGSNPAEIGQVLAESAGGMFIADRFGTPRWLDYLHAPARVDLDSSDFGWDLMWDVDQSLSFTEVQVDGVPKATTGGFPKTARSIAGLLPDVPQAGYVRWLANTADVWGGPRLSGVAVNLWPMTAPKVSTYLGLDLKSRVFPTGLPAQLPTPWVQTIEGYVDYVDDKQWTLAFNLAPDPRFVLGDSVAGVLGSGYRVGARL